MPPPPKKLRKQYVNADYPNVVLRFEDGTRSSSSVASARRSTALPARRSSCWPFTTRTRVSATSSRRARPRSSTTPDGRAGAPVGSPEGGPAPLHWHPDVAAARARGVPIVALESSVFAQGLRPPANRDAFRRMTGAVRARGAEPAVTAVAAGRAVVGLDDALLERFLGAGAQKVSARDLGPAIATGVDGATTVAAALAIAAAAGIDLFATGGIGGVHRGAAYDESADLAELARTSAIVVCTGAKAILDLPATLERLESLGVTVVGCGTDEFPGFFTGHTGLQVPHRIDSPPDLARAWLAARALGRPGALLVVQPPPVADALDRATVDRAVATALEEAEAAGVRGGALTPYLLEAVARVTAGRSVRANLALLEANAALAAEIAVALAEARRAGR